MTGVACVDVVVTDLAILRRVDGEFVIEQVADGFSAEEVRLAAEVRQATPPRAVFVTGEEPTNPIADLAGRSVLISYPGWLWSSGINYAQREADLARIYNGGPAALALLSHYHVRYLVVGPSERATLHPNVDYFSATFRLVLQSANYQIYQVPD